MYAADLINLFLLRKKEKSNSHSPLAYLEIGLWDGGTFNQIKADIKKAVDPDKSKNADYKVTSDVFFLKHAPKLKYKFDVIFIDGLHHSEQVDRDIENSIQYLNEGGVIILHDCNPISEMRQRVPADFDIWEHGWNGDVWKSIFNFRKTQSHLEYDTFVIDSDEGLGVIIPNEIGKKLELEVPEIMDYKFLSDNRDEILNLISVNTFKNKYFNIPKKPNLHFITYANGVHRTNGHRFELTQKLLTGTIQNKTNYNVIFHTHNLETLKVQPWFYKVKDWPEYFTNEWWKRDGYCCAYKVFLTKQVMDIADDGDLIYYVDSSAYHIEPFTENIDRFLKYVEYNGHVIGSAANDCKHNSFNCCDDKRVWKKVYSNIDLDYEKTLNKLHLNAAWFCFKKNKTNSDFVNEWAYWFTHKLNKKPLCMYHHTVDQSILNMLVYKYGFKCFYNEKNSHEENKNHNIIHRQLNLEKDDGIYNLKKWFHNPNNL